MTKGESNSQQSSTPEDDDEPDEWDVRINKTGCADENMKLLDCHYEKKDWRLCVKEMEDFKKCWKDHGNDQRTSSKDVGKEGR